MADLIQTVWDEKIRERESQQSTTSSEQGFTAQIGATALYASVVEVRLETTS